MAAQSVEIVIPQGKTTRLAQAMLDALANTAGDVFEHVDVTVEYQGRCQWLVIYGVGRAPRDEWRQSHIVSGGRVLLLDVGYFGERKLTCGYVRMSINTHHPAPFWLDLTPPDPSRWARHGIRLRDDYNERGPVILVGMGRKSHAHYGGEWEATKLAELQERFPDREIVYRPKPRNPALPLNVRTEHDALIADVLRGASLVVCRHSNVAVDAVIAGVPLECDDGAAKWLMRRSFTKENRLDFLRRLAWWQWTASEAAQMLRFAKQVVASAG